MSNCNYDTIVTDKTISNGPNILINYGLSGSSGPSGNYPINTNFSKNMTLLT
jgi:hypothetical protein